MKNLILTVTLIFSISILAQSTPEPPEPPQTSNSQTINRSVHIDNDVSHSSSVSVTESDDSFKFKASFNKSKTEEIKKLIIDKLGKENQILKNNTYLWNRILNDEEVFTCKLKKGNLRIYVEKDGVSESLYHKIKDLGEELKHIISGSSYRKTHKKDTEHAKRDLEHAERDLERAKRDLERAKKEVERTKKKN